MAWRTRLAKRRSFGVLFLVGWRSSPRISQSRTVRGLTFAAYAAAARVVPDRRRDTMVSSTCLVRDGLLGGRRIIQIPVEDASFLAGALGTARSGVRLLAMALPPYPVRPTAPDNNEDRPRRVGPAPSSGRIRDRARRDRGPAPGGNRHPFQ